jgi:alpha-amylase
LSKETITKKLTVEKRKPLNLPKSVPFENGFHFFIEHGKYIGITATSTVEFAEKLQIIPIESIMFHFQRGDFQKWLSDTIGDEELARRMDQIKEWSSDENLRKELFKTVHNRITQLTKSSQQISS